MSDGSHTPCCPYHGQNILSQNKPVQDNKRSRRNSLKAGVVASTTLLLPEQGIAAQYGRSIKSMRGVVRVNRRQAQSYTPIKAGDTVEVAPGGFVRFVVERDSYLLRGGSRLRIESSGYGIISGLRLFTGALMGVFEKGGLRQVRTNHATIGIRGTGIYLDSKPEETYFCTCYGETEIEIAGHKEVVTATHHNALLLKTPKNNPWSIDRSIGMLGHSDDELRESEYYVGRRVPFDK